MQNDFGLTVENTKNILNAEDKARLFVKTEEDTKKAAKKDRKRKGNGKGKGQF